MDLRRLRVKVVLHLLPFSILVVLSAACIGAASQYAASATSDGTSAAVDHRTWSDYGGGPDQSKYVVLDEITKSNVGQLEVAWFYPTGDENVYQFNPIVVDGVMYVLAKNNSLVALDAATGEEIWIHANLRGIARRGINYWESDDRSDRRLLFQMNNYLQAIDARTGESILGFGENGLVDLKLGLDRDPETVARIQSGTPGAVFENLILLGSGPGEGYLSAPGHLRAYDVVTGELVWTFRTIPHPGEFGYETWPEDAYRYVGGANTWGDVTIDRQRGIAYFPTGSPTYDYYGADRIGTNLFGNSLLALDARTGERLWHFQAVHHDLWDYDLAAAPQLVTVRHSGRQIDAVAVATKHGFLFAFDRVSGEPLWPIEERPVPPSHVPGEQAWPTQPFPTVLPPFARQQITAADINPFLLTPEEQEEWKERVDALVRSGRTGLFTPLSHQHPTLTVPGAVGGASWGNTAANPDRGMVYVFSIDWPSFYDSLERRASTPGRDGVPMVNPLERGRDLYVQNCQVCHGADRAGSGTGPSLLDVGGRMSLQDVRHVIATGRGKMPAFPHLDADAVTELYRYIGGFAQGARPVTSDLPPSGPVVGSGGAPGRQLPRPVVSAGGRLGAPYPEGIEVPADRYYIQGFGLSYAHVIRPPWSTITAYDLNQGTIRWRRPIGTDLHAARAGWDDTGVPHAQRHGMVVTSTGIVFSTARDGRVYGLDADDGAVLWTGDLPTGSEGLPAMYEADGRHYLVVTATTPLRWGRGSQDADNAVTPRPQGGYVVFALPRST